MNHNFTTTIITLTWHGMSSMTRPPLYTLCCLFSSCEKTTNKQHFLMSCLQWINPLFVFVLPTATATLWAVVWHWWRARPGKDADPRCKKGVREVGRLSGTICGASCFCHKCRELPPSNKGRPALSHPGSTCKSQNVPLLFFFLHYSPVSSAIKLS